MVLLSAHFHRVLRTALENSVVAKIPTCLLQWMEILNVVNLEEKSSKINSIPRLETAFLDCSINVLLWKKKTFPLHTSFLKIHHSLFSKGALKNTCSEHLPAHPSSWGEGSTGLALQLTARIHLKMQNLLLPLCLHSFGKFQALFIGEILGGRKEMYGLQ